MPKKLSEIQKEAYEEALGFQVYVAHLFSQHYGMASSNEEWEENYAKFKKEILDEAENICKGETEITYIEEIIYENGNKSVIFPHIKLEYRKLNCIYNLGREAKNKFCNLWDGYSSQGDIIKDVPYEPFVNLIEEYSRKLEEHGSPNQQIKNLEFLLTGEKS